MPFLPGDSLLFVAGSLAAVDASTGEASLNLLILLIVLFVAAVLGDTVNYSIGHYLGPKVFRRDYKLLKRSHLLKTQAFYEKHGGLTIIIARFMPIIRTFAPFVAGVSAMHYGKFISFNVIGGALWVVLFLLAGYFFGQIPWVQQNFELVALAIIIVSVIPPLVEFAKSRIRSRKVSA
jgi:membrane-associated protein